MRFCSKLKSSDSSRRVLNQLEISSVSSVLSVVKSFCLLTKAIAGAGEAFNKIFGKTVTAVDGRKVLIQRAGEDIFETFRHITQHNEPGLEGEYNLEKLRVVPMIQKTLQNAQARLRDVDNNSLIYVRRIGNNDWHSVVVREDGTIEDQTVTARLATQFSMSRQARQFRLPVDQEETSLALWRVNTPLVQSGEPEPRNRSTNNEGTGAVNPKSPMSPAGDAMKMIAKLTGSETKTTFNGGTYTAGGALSPDDLETAILRFARSLRTPLCG